MFDIFTEKYNTNKEFFNNLVWRTVQVFGKQGASFLIYLVGTAVISRNEMGVYNYIMGLAGLLIMFVDIGISTSTSKFIAEYSVRDSSKIRGIVANSLLIVLVCAVLTISVAYVLWPHIIDKGVVSNSNTVFLMVALIIIFSPISSVYDGVYRGLRRFKEQAVLSVITGIVAVLVSIPLSNSYGVMGALGAQVILYFVLTALFASRYGTLRWIIDKYQMRNVLSYAINFGIASLGYYLFSRITVVIMGYFGYFEELAAYELLNRGFIIIILPFTIIGQVLSPYITRAYAEGDIDGVKIKYFKALKYMIFTSILFSAVTIIVSPIIIETFFPVYFDNLLVQMLVPVTIIYAQMALSAPLNAGFIVATGHARLMTILNIVTGLITTVAIYFIVKIYGFMPSIYANLVAQTISLLILQYMYVKALQVKPRVNIIK